MVNALTELWVADPDPASPHTHRTDPQLPPPPFRSSHHILFWNLYELAHQAGLEEWCLSNSLWQISPWGVRWKPVWWSLGSFACTCSVFRKTAGIRRQCGWQRNSIAAASVDAASHGGLTLDWLFLIPHPQASEGRKASKRSLLLLPDPDCSGSGHTAFTPSCLAAITC